MTVEMRKRSYDEISGEDLSGSDQEDTQDNFDIDEMLTQKNSFNDPKRRSKIERRVMMTQAAAINSQKDKDEANYEGKCGFIKRVSLKNFMCHANFELSFGRRLNFIIGHNGSGKSAILTAISVCLGAKATETNRGSNLKDLIREGTNGAQVTVVLSNDGIDAYEPHKYGKEIIVERSIKRDSKAFPYILKSENGKRVASKREDLDAILDHFRIAISNPMSFLSQDAARSFLTASTDEQKYKFFMRGTMMEEILNNFKSTKDRLEKMDLKLFRMKDEVSQLKEEAKEAKRILERLNSSNELRTRQAHLYGKYFFMDSDKTAKTIESVNNTEIELKQVLEQIENSIKNLQKKVDNFENEKELLIQKKAAIKEQYDEATADAEEKKKKAYAFTSKAEEKARNLKEMQKTIQEDEKKIKELEANIHKEEEKQRQRNGGSRDVLEQQLDDLKTQQDDYEDEIASLKQESNAINESKRGAYDELDREINSKREEIRGLQQTLERAVNDKQDPLAPYGSNLRRLVQDIERTKFSSKPIGPVGAFISIKPEFDNFRGAINANLRKVANSFIVSNLRDQRLLQQLMKKNNAFAAIIVRRRESFDYSRGLPDRRYRTILDALEFAEEDVKYTLIDNNGIESIVLSHERTEGQQILESGARNVNMVLALFSKTEGVSMSINTNGAFRSDPSYYGSYSDQKILKSGNKGFDIDGLKQEIHALQRELSDLQARRNNLSNESEQKKRKIADRIKAVTLDLRKVKSQTYHLERKLKDDADDGKLEAYRDQKNIYMTEIARYTETLVDVEEEVEKYKDAAKDAFVDYEEAKVTLNGVRKLAAEYRGFEDDIDAKREYNVTQIRHFLSSKEKRENELEQLIANKPAWEQKYKETIEQAERHCTREQADAIRITTLDEVKREIERVTERVERANQDLGKSPEEIVNEDAIARGKYKDAFNQLHSAQISRQVMRAALHERIKSFRETRDGTCVAADMDFKESLQFRNFSGNLEFDFEKKKLKMFVSTKNDKKPRHVDSLSGGEKSFSQISLLLATWKPMRSRIRGLDEFDVFMDQVNRKIGMRLMMKKLSSEMDSQTIFITPQDIGQIADLDPKLVAIHRVKDPRAGRPSS